MCVLEKRKNYFGSDDEIVKTNNCIKYFTKRVGLFSVGSILH